MRTSEAAGTVGTLSSHQDALPAGLPSPLVLLWLITCCIMLQPLSTDMYLASLPHLARDFNASPAVVQQTLSLFVLGFGGAQLVMGPLSDRFGRRPVLLWGLALYFAASVLCALAWTMEVLIAGRFAQAVGCCTAVLVARALVRDAYAPHEGAQIIARSSTLMAFAPLLGPILGAYLQVAFGWRAAFVVHTLAGALLALAVWRKLPETNRQKDPSATRLSGLAANYGAILRAPVFWAYALPGALSYASIFVFISGSSFVLINVLKVPTQYFGYCFGFGVSGFLLGTISCRRLLRRMPVERVLGVGIVVALAASTLFLALVLLGAHHWASVVGCLFLVMYAHGINFPCAQTGAVAPFPARAGAAAGMLGFLMMMAALGIGTVVGGSHDGTLYPLAYISSAVGLGVFATALALSRFRQAPA